jgi:hypothetical protein
LGLSECIEPPSDDLPTIQYDVNSFDSAQVRAVRKYAKHFPSLQAKGRSVYDCSIRDQLLRAAAPQ